MKAEVYYKSNVINIQMKTLYAILGEGRINWNNVEWCTDVYDNNGNAIFTLLTATKTGLCFELNHEFADKFFNALIGE